MTSWIVGTDPIGLRLAQARAELDGRRVLAADSIADPRIGELAGSARSVLVIGTDISHAQASALVAAFATADRSDTKDRFDVGCPIGFLHARTAEALQALSARQATPSAGRGRPDLLIDATASNPPDQVAEGIRQLPYREASAAAVQAAGPLRLLAITSHGMGDLLHLNDDFICGRASRPSTTPGGLGYLPSCMQADSVCLFKPDGHRLPAQQLNAEHVFVNACGSLRFERGEFGADFSLWYAALEGNARSYVGTLRWKDGHGLEAVLYRQLLAAGYPLGLAVSILNRVLRQHHIEDGPVYCLLGDPDEQATGAEPAGPVGELGAGLTTLPMVGGHAHYLLSDTELIEAWRADQLLIWAEREDVTFSVVPALHEPVLHVFAAAYGNSSDSIRARVLDYRPLRARAAEVGRSTASTLNPALGINGMYPNAVRQGGRLNLENRVLNISRLYRKTRTEARLTSKLLQNHDRLEREVAALDEKTAVELLQRICTTVYRFSEHYQDSFALDGVIDGPDCRFCGAGTSLRVQRSLIAEAVTRTETICPLCGTLADVPDRALLLQLDSPAMVAREQEFEAMLTITNQDRLPVHGYCLAGVRKAELYGASGPDRVTEFELKPGQATTIGLPFRFAQRSAAHQYDVQAAMVSTGRIYLARRPVGVLDTSGTGGDR